MSKKHPEQFSFWLTRRQKDRLTVESEEAEKSASEYLRILIMARENSQQMIRRAMLWTILVLGLFSLVLHVLAVGVIVYTR